MPIHMITNNTGGTLELWDVGTQLANLAPGNSVHTVPTTITSVTLNGVGHHKKTGGFMNDLSYSATVLGQSVKFDAGGGNVVTFT